MTVVHPRASPGVLVVGRSVGTATLALVIGVTFWWLGIFGAIVLTVPTATTGSNELDLALWPGRLAHLHALPVPEWSIPVGRLEFDAYNLALDRDDEAALARIAAVAEWIPVRSDQEVRVLLIDDDAVQVELLEGADSGRRGWLKRKHLTP